MTKLDWRKRVGTRVTRLTHREGEKRDHLLQSAIRYSHRCDRCSSRAPSTGCQRRLISTAVDWRFWHYAPRCWWAIDVYRCTCDTRRPNVLDLRIQRREICHISVVACKRVPLNFAYSEHLTRQTHRDFRRSWSLDRTRTLKRDVCLRNSRNNHTNPTERKTDTMDSTNNNERYEQNGVSWWMTWIKMSVE